MLESRIQMFEILARQHESMLTAYVRAIIRDHAMADDVAQMTWLVAWKKIHTLNAAANFPAWLRGIARFEAMNALRKRKREQLVEFSEMEAVDVAFSKWEAKSEVPGLETALSALEQCYEELPDTLRLVCRQHYFHNVKAREISASHSLSLAAVLKRLERSREALRDCMRNKFKQLEA